MFVADGNGCGRSTIAVAAGDHSGHAYGHDLLRLSRDWAYRPFFTMYERSSTVRQL